MTDSMVEAMQERARRRAEGGHVTLDEALAVLKDHLERGKRARRLLMDVEAMRTAQKEYFQSRSKEQLVRAKELEATVDAGLDELRRK